MNIIFKISLTFLIWIMMLMIGFTAVGDILGKKYVYPIILLICSTFGLFIYCKYILNLNTKTTIIVVLLFLFLYYPICFGLLVAFVALLLGK